MVFIANILNFFRIVYEEAKESDIDRKEVVFCKKSTIQTGSISGSSSTHGSVTSPMSPCQTMSCTVEDVLQLLRHLFVIYTRPENENSLCTYLKSQKTAPKKEKMSDFFFVVVIV